MLKYELGIGRLNFNWAFLKGNKLLVLCICKSSSFDSEMTCGKNEYLKTSILQ